MRFWCTVALMVAGLSLSGAAQDYGKPYRVQPSNEFKVKDQSKLSDSPKSSVMSPPKTENASARNLQSIERENAKIYHAEKKPPAAHFHEEKERATPAIDFKGNNSGVKNVGMSKSGDPFKGRVKEKKTY